MRDSLRAAGLTPLDGESAIVPIIVGETALAIDMSRQLLDRGVYVTGFGYQVVPEGTARIRVQVSAALTEAQIATAVQAIAAVASGAEVAS
jgi:glycine C-acetyltransferase